MDYLCFRDLVGFRLDDLYAITGGDPANAYLYSSESGLWVNDLASNLINLQTISEAHRENEDTEEFIRRIHESAIREVFENYKVFRTATKGVKDLLSPGQAIIKGGGNFNHKVSKEGRFVGFQIDTKSFAAISLLIQRIGFQFDSVQDLPVYLYSDDTFAPIVEYTLNSNVPYSVTWINGNVFNDPNVLRLSNNNGQTYYLGYYEDDLTGYAIEKRNFAWQPCGCSNDPYYNYLSVRSIAVPASGHDASRNMFDREKIQFTSSNFGLNIEPYVECDLSKIYCDQRDRFSLAIQYKAAIKVLEAIYQTLEPNRLSMTDAGKMAYGRKQELEKEYSEIIKSVNIDFSGLDKPCLPSNSPWGVMKISR